MKLKFLNLALLLCFCTLRPVSAIFGIKIKCPKFIKRWFTKSDDSLVKTGDKSGRTEANKTESAIAEAELLESKTGYSSLTPVGQNLQQEIFLSEHEEVKTEEFHNFTTLSDYCKYDEASQEYLPAKEKTFGKYMKQLLNSDKGVQQIIRKSKLDLLRELKRWFPNTRLDNAELQAAANAFLGCFNFNARIKLFYPSSEDEECEREMVKKLLDYAVTHAQVKLESCRMSTRDTYGTWHKALEETQESLNRYMYRSSDDNPDLVETFENVRKNVRNIYSHGHPAITKFRHVMEDVELSKEDVVSLVAHAFCEIRRTSSTTLTNAQLLAKYRERDIYKHWCRTLIIS